jgi:hypothetical protein
VKNRQITRFCRSRAACLSSRHTSSKSPFVAAKAVLALASTGRGGLDDVRSDKVESAEPATQPGPNGKADGRGPKEAGQAKNEIDAAD